jgi:hypothetical protein
VNAVTLDDIKKVASKYFRDQPYVLATVQPPASENATAGKPESSAAAKQKYQGTAVSSPPPKTQRKR